MRGAYVLTATRMRCSWAVCLRAMSFPSLESTAVVTVTYNSSTQLAPFLDSVRSNDGEVADIIVADNKSTDVEATRQISESYRAHILELNDNRGYGGAINQAVATLPATIEYILISNPDVEISEGAISTLVARISREQGTAAVGPKVLNADGSTYPSARRLPSLRTGVGHALFSGIWPNNPWSRSYRSDTEGSNTERYVGWLSGSFVLVRRSAFEQIGGFDEGFFMYFEDVDLGYRLGKSGWKSLYVPSAAVTHTGAHSTNTESSKMIRIHHDSANRYLRKKYSAPILAPLRLALRVGLSVRSWYLTRATVDQNQANN